MAFHDQSRGGYVPPHLRGLSNGANIQQQPPGPFDDRRGGGFGGGGGGYSRGGFRGPSGGGGFRGPAGGGGFPRGSSWGGPEEADPFAQVLPKHTPSPAVAVPAVLMSENKPSWTGCPARLK